MNDPTGDDRWELGSLFHHPGVDEAGAPRPWEGGLLTGCGRDAIRWAIRAGGFRRVWMPSYFCQEVVRSVHREAAVALYPDTPDRRHLDLRALPLRGGDAVFVANLFGLRRQQDVTLPPSAPPVIEDHTHDPTSPWAFASEATYCVASLRKLYPLPDGGALWSPRGLPLDALPLRDELARASATKLAGMAMKSSYLRGEDVSKAAFRELLARGEAALEGEEPSGMTPFSRDLLAGADLVAWRRGQRRKLELLAPVVAGAAGVRLLEPSAPACVAFGAVLVFDEAERRDTVHRALIERRVYAARLWPLDDAVAEGVRPEDRALFHRSFVIPIDMRYADEDIRRAATALQTALEAASRAR